MKKYFLATAALATTLVLGACSNKDEIGLNLPNGNENFITSTVKNVTKQEVFDKMVTDAGLSALLDLVDYDVLSKKYEIDTTEVDTAVETYKKMYPDFENFLISQGFKDEEDFRQYFELNLYREAAARAAVTVTDEEAVQRGFSYVSMSKLDAEGEALSEADLQAAKDKLAAVSASVEAGNTMDAAAVENGLTSYPGNYGDATEVFYDEALIAALKETSEGAVTEIVETEKELYLAVVTADVDEEATASRRETILNTKQTEYFNNILKAWVEEYPLNVNASVWEAVVFDRSYEVKAD